MIPRIFPIRCVDIIRKYGYLIIIDPDISLYLFRIAGYNDTVFIILYRIFKLMDTQIIFYAYGLKLSIFISHCIASAYRLPGCVLPMVKLITRICRKTCVIKRLDRRRFSLIIISVKKLFPVTVVSRNIGQLMGRFCGYVISNIISILYVIRIKIVYRLPLTGVLMKHLDFICIITVCLFRNAISYICIFLYLLRAIAFFIFCINFFGVYIQCSVS